MGIVDLLRACRSTDVRSPNDRARSDLPDVTEPENTQDATTWRTEAATITVTRCSILWRSPSRYEMPPDATPPPDPDEIFADAAASL